MVESRVWSRSLPLADLSMPALSVPSLRDPAGWKALRGLAHRRLERPSDARCLRAWVPHCANGEEAYSIAIRLFESLGARWREVQLRIFCTDTDSRALSTARTGRYSRAAARRMSPDSLERFFIHGPNGLTVRPSFETRAASPTTSPVGHRRFRAST